MVAIGAVLTGYQASTLAGSRPFVFGKHRAAQGFGRDEVMRNDQHCKEFGAADRHRFWWYGSSQIPKEHFLPYMMHLIRDIHPDVE
jgi:hypothetical protein